jgi:electron transfer flavoprotein beta subunit
VNILVCLKQVPDTETQIKIAPDGMSIATDNIKWIINPYDEYAVEEALQPLLVAIPSVQPGFFPQ